MTGRVSRSGRRRQLVRVIVPVVAIIVGAVAIARAAAPDPGSALVLEHSGSLANDPFGTPATVSSLVPSYRPGGTATSSGGSLWVGADGLHVDVTAHRPGTWKGYYLATAAAFPADAVIHVRMSRPVPQALRASQSGITLLAVQTAASDALDYVLVADVVTPTAQAWIVGYAHGNATFATTRVLASVPTSSPVEDVTLRTDGGSRYSVYFGRTPVYTARNVRLGVTPPLRVYLEVEAKGAAYQTRFRDFWVAASNTVAITGLSPGDRVTLTPDGFPAIDAVADATGTARLTVPVVEAVGVGTLTVDSSLGRRVHTIADVKYSGGDVYRYHG